MKFLNSYIRSGIIIFILFAGMISCKKEDYLTDGGVHQAYTSQTTYDYLQGNKYHYFDTVILLIDHFHLKDSVNKAGTFFAFTDFSLNTFMKNRGYASVEQLYDSVSSRLLTQYMFSDTSISLYSVSTNAVQYPNWAGDTARCAVKKVQGSYGIYLTSSAPVFDYYTLAYVKINGVPDGSAGAPPDDVNDVAIPCQTSGIKTTSGTTLHVLANNALLNKL